jgi:hypothetical protein
VTGRIAVIAGAGAAALALAAVGGGPSAPSADAANRRPAPVVEHMVVFRNGTYRAKRVSSRGLRVRVGRRRCAVATGTPLAALVRARPSRRIGLKDFGSCSRRSAADSAQLFVRRIAGDVNRGNRGWVYKVGRKVGTAGAADPSGPFGRRRLRRGQRVTWFYCADASQCQRTLELRASAPGGGAVSVRVVAYDDQGKGVNASGAEVRLGGLTATTNADGLVSFAGVAPGRYGIRATRSGNVRTYPQRVTVR